MIPANTAWGNAVGSGTTGPFAIPFTLYSQSHLTVLQVNVTVPTVPVVTTMNLGTDYTFTAWTPDNKGQVQNPAITFTNAVGAGILIIFLLVLPQTQLTAFTSGPYSPGAAEAADDILTQMCQQLWQWAAKTVRAPDWEAGGATNLIMPPIAIRANKVAGWDVAGNLIATLASNVGTVTFTAFGQTLVGLASLTALLQLLGLYIGPAAVANGAALAAIATPQGGWIAYQTDTGVLWGYNASAAAWNQISWSQP